MMMIMITKKELYCAEQCTAYFRGCRSLQCHRSSLLSSLSWACLSLSLLLVCFTAAAAAADDDDDDDDDDSINL